ncbi:HalOD1 output domain-containing protein [Halomicroarcula sp. GCM10025817]|uniref:HalOD1 output domain-containing protein n=1 Tax=Haloarcula TaxID=2237 RepID=UPI0023E83044|nr:HalOD1 output domain-containing protein [Halomicroarcula sp. SYNS111]
MREKSDTPEAPGTSVRDSFDSDGDAKPSDRVVQTVAVLTDTDPVDLPALYDAVDPEALNQLVSPEAATHLNICFTYAGTEVYFGEDGDLEVTLLDD